MEEFDDLEKNPLDILDSDGDDALEISLFFDKDDDARKRKPGNNTMKSGSDQNGTSLSLCNKP